MERIENVRINDASISMADHGALTFHLTLEGDGWCTSFGGYCIGHGYIGAKPDVFEAESGLGLVAMMRIMDVVGVERWEDLKGNFARVKTPEWGRPINVIGNIMQDRWFDIHKFFMSHGEESE